MNRKALYIIAIIIGVIFIGKGSYIHAKAILAQYLLQNAWQQTLSGENQVKPWQWADTWPVARLKMPAKDIDQIVLEGDTGNVLAFGPGHMTLSAKPGENGICVLSGHRDTHFYFLKTVKPGDQVELQTPDSKIHKYKITSIDILPTDEIDIDFESNESKLILITCYPFDTYADENKRLVVMLDPLL